MILDLPDPGLAHVIAEAAFDSARWADVCDGMARLTGAEGCIVVPVDVDQRALALTHSPSLDDLVTSYQKGEWYKADTRARGAPIMQRRGYFTDADIVTPTEIDRSDYYQDLLRPAGFLWFAALGFQSGANTYALSIQRRLNAQPFSNDDLRPALAYCDLLTSSATVASQLGHARMGGAASALEQHGLCAIALDGRQRVTFISPSAEPHLSDGLLLTDGRLRARNSHDAPALARLIHAISAKVPGVARLHATISRVGGKVPLVVYGCSLSGAQCDLFQPAVGLLVILDPQHPRQIPITLLIDYFGFTQAEAVLGAALVAGNSVEEHARRHGTSPITVRNQLQSLLRKTSTHRQGELIAVLNKIIPA